MSQSQQSRRWFITINNYTSADIDALREIECNYIVACTEIAPTTGTPHVHALVIFNTNKRFFAVKRLVARADIEIVKGTFNQAYDYVTKDGRIILEEGDKPKEKHNVECTFKAMVQAAKDGTIDKECLMYCRYEKFFSRFEKREEFCYDGELSCKNAWIYGPPGTGKSRLVREYARSRGYRIYEKLSNKWWDNYDGEEVVLMEDLDPKVCEVLIHHIKLWADRYPFRAEVKGGSKRLLPKFQLIVTSHYSLSECFTGPDGSAICRRFDEWEMN
ncbi:replication-associated protein [Odonata-associated circular virus-14]|uniref:Replication-associated protein n=1 Tax=Odonata-associated circular virus-14 TaxID=1592114 RepID=A0A0B4UI10_9VIRU|nr:replication-associated protein [Odonata-associated circular virus-14]AJD07485.1 replication-associated protein [Odonata-associated circular virus-14]